MAKKTITPEDHIEQLLRELLVFGFAAAKEIARLRGQTSGTMPCPMCQQPLRFSVSPSNNHFHARCKTENCIRISE